ncbi:MAG: ROK family protein [Thermoanaerobacteraceae bacterium]|nr:ROK family protein [Thermoanaerobacteraceae bacterium]
MAGFVIGLDLGGTKIATCLMDKSGSIVKKVTVPTLAIEGPDAVISRMKSSVYEVMKQANVKKKDIVAMGVGSPGPLDAKNGVIKNPPNLPGWVEVPLRDELYNEFKLPIIIENDANAAALGENLYGSGKGMKNFMYITISTGIGGGVVADGKLFKGANGNAVEIGHTTINFQGPLCGCGNKGCWEAYASGTALARFMREGIESGKTTIIKDIEDVKNIKAEHVFAAAKQGDKFARELVDMEGYYLGVGLANMANSFNPDCIAMGGGITHEWDLFYDRMIEVMREKALKANVENLKVVKATLGSDVGVVGAAAVAWGLV